jgi:hypothetical protein
MQFRLRQTDIGQPAFVGCPVQYHHFSAVALLLSAGKRITIIAERSISPMKWESDPLSKILPIELYLF